MDGSDRIDDDAAATSPSLGLPRIFEKCVHLLSEMFDEERSLFSYSTDIVGGRLVNDFDHPLHMRYTINTWLGLVKLSEHHQFDWDVPAGVDRFLARNLDDVTNPGDQGLLLYLLARAGHDRLPELYKRFVTDDLISDERLNPLPVQELCWILIGLTASATSGIADAEDKAHRVFSRLDEQYVDHRSQFIRHSLQPVRRDFVSFGAMVYYLKSWAEYASAFDNERARRIVSEAVPRVIDRQLADGGWPWFYHVPSGRVMDVYEVYGVHQDAMAMLFLFPARAFGVDGIDQATRRSVQWLYGSNDLGRSMINDDPFLIHRSIRRKSGAGRGARLVRGVVRGPLGLSARPVEAAKLEVNPECRSYHIGWLVYAWADQPDPDSWFSPAP
jgi:hypothetical protein